MYNVHTSGLKSNAHFQINRKLVLHNNIFHEIITDTSNGQILKKNRQDTFRKEDGIIGKMMILFLYKHPQSS